jgi:hypothetical protein
LIQHGDGLPVVTGNTLDSAQSLKSFTALRDEVASDFEHRTRVEDFDVYIRRE